MAVPANPIENAITQANQTTNQLDQMNLNSQNNVGSTYDAYIQFRNSQSTIQQNPNANEQKLADIINRSADLAARGLHRANSNERTTSAVEKNEVEQQAQAISDAIRRLVSRDSETQRSHIQGANSLNEYDYQIKQLNDLSEALSKIQEKVYHPNEVDNTSDQFKSQLEESIRTIKDFSSNLTNLRTNLADSLTVPQEELLNLKVLESVLGNVTGNVNSLRGALQNTFQNAISVDSNNLKLLEQINSETITAGKALEALSGLMTQAKQWEGPDILNALQGSYTVQAETQAALNTLAGTADSMLSHMAETSLGNIADMYSSMIDMNSNLIQSYTMTGAALKKFQLENPNIDTSEAEQKQRQGEAAAKAKQADLAFQMREGLRARLKQINDDIEAGIATSLNQMARGQNLSSNYTSNIRQAGDKAAEAWQSIAAYEKQNRWFSINGIGFGPKGTRFGTMQDDLSFISQVQFETSGVMPQIIGKFDEAQRAYQSNKFLEGDMYKQQGTAQFKTAVEMQVKMSERARAVMDKWRTLSTKEKERWGGQETEKKIVASLEGIKNANLELIQMQSAYNIEVDSDTKKKLHSLGKDSKAFANIREELKNTEKESLISLAKIKGFASSVASSIRNFAYGTKGLLDKFGLGSAFMGPIDTIVKALQYHSEQGKARYGAMGIDASIGYTDLGDSAVRAQSRLMRGNELYRMSGGMIKREEINDLYRGLVKNVGGQYGGTATQTVQDMERFATSLTPLKTVYGVSDTTLQNAVKIYYKDMNMSAKETEDAVAKLTIAAQNANVPLESYLSKVTNIAQAFMKIGIDGQRASVILNNFLNRGVRADVAEEISQQMGSGLAKFAENDNLVAFSAATMGIDPFHAMAQMARTHDAKGNVRSAWVDEASALADNAMNYFMMPYGNDPNLQYWGRVKTYKQLFGFNQRTASTLASAAEKYGTESVEFKNLFKEKMEAEENPNATLEKLNDKILGQLQSMSGQLAESDKIQAQLDANLYGAASIMGRDLDKIVREIAPILLAFQDEMIKWTVRALAFLTNLVKSEDFKTAVEALVEGIHAIPNLLSAALDKISKGWDSLKEFFTGKDSNTGEDAADKIAGTVNSGASMLELPTAVGVGAAVTKAIPGPLPVKLLGGTAAGLATYFGLDTLRDFIFSPRKDENGNVSPSMASSVLRGPTNYIGNNLGGLVASLFFIGRHAPGLWKIPATLLAHFIGSQLVDNGPVGMYDNAMGTIDSISNAIAGSDWWGAAKTLGVMGGSMFLGSKLIGGLLTSLSTSNPLRSGIGKWGTIGATAMILSSIGGYAYNSLFGGEQGKKENEQSIIGSIISNIFGGSNKASAATIDQANAQLNIPTSAEQIKQWDEQLKAAGYTDEERRNILSIHMNPYISNDNNHLGLSMIGLHALKMNHQNILPEHINRNITTPSKFIKFIDAIIERINVMRLSPENLNKYHAEYGTMTQRIKNLFKYSWQDLKEVTVNVFKNLRDSVKVWFLNQKLKWKNWRRKNVIKDAKNLYQKISKLQSEINNLHPESFWRKIKETRLENLKNNYINKFGSFDKVYKTAKGMELHDQVHNIKNAKNELTGIINARKSFKNLVNNTMNRAYKIFAPDSSMEYQIKQARQNLIQLEKKLRISQKDLRLALKPFTEAWEVVERAKINNGIDFSSKAYKEWTKLLERTGGNVTLKDGTKLAYKTAQAQLKEITESLEGLMNKNAVELMKQLKITDTKLISKINIHAKGTNDLIKVSGVNTRNTIRQNATKLLNRVKNSINSTAVNILERTGSVGKAIANITISGYEFISKRLANIVSIAQKIGEFFKIPGLGAAGKAAEGAAEAATGLKGFLKWGKGIPVIGAGIDTVSYIMDVANDMQSGVSFSAAAWERLKEHSTDLALAYGSLIHPGFAVASMAQGISYIATGKGIDEHIGDLIGWHLTSPEKRQNAYIQDLTQQGISPELAQLVIQSNGGFNVDTARILQYAHGITTKEELEALMSGNSSSTYSLEQDTNSIEPLEKAPESELEQYRNSSEYQQAQDLERERNNASDETSKIINNDTNKDDSDNSWWPNFSLFSKAHAADKGFLRGGTYSKELIERTNKSDIYNDDARKILAAQLPQFDEQRKANIEAYNKKIKEIDKDTSIKDEDKKTLKEQTFKDFENKDRNIQIKQDNLLAVTAGKDFDAKSFNMDEFNKQTPDEKNSRFGTAEDKIAWEQTTGNITSGMAINANDRPETRTEAAESRAKVANKTIKSINDEQKESQKLSKDRNKLTEDFVKLHTKLMGDFQDSVTEQHKNLWKMLAVTHQILVDLNKTVARGAAFATDAILRFGGGGSGGNGGNYQSGNISANASAEERGRYIYKQLIANGMDKMHAAAIMGNLSQENSTFDPTLLNDPKDPNSAFGIAQWLGTRRTGLQQFAAARNKTEDDLDTQIAYMLYEFQHNESSAYQAFMKETNLDDATKTFRLKYERPGAWEANDNNRITQAKNFYNLSDSDINTTDKNVHDDRTDNERQVWDSVQWKNDAEREVFQYLNDANYSSDAINTIMSTIDYLNEDWNTTFDDNQGGLLKLTAGSELANNVAKLMGNDKSASSYIKAALTALGANNEYQWGDYFSPRKFNMFNNRVGEFAGMHGLGLSENDINKIRQNANTRSARFKQISDAAPKSWQNTTVVPNNNSNTTAVANHQSISGRGNVLPIYDQLTDITSGTLSPNVACTPTAIAMYATAMTGKTITPNMVNANYNAVLSSINQWTGLEHSEEYINPTQDKSRILQQLANGSPMVLYFTHANTSANHPNRGRGTHAIVLAGINANNTLRIHDPNQGKIWNMSYEELMSVYNGPTSITGYFTNGKPTNPITNWGNVTASSGSNNSILSPGINNLYNSIYTGHASVVEYYNEAYHKRVSDAVRISNQGYLAQGLVSDDDDNGDKADEGKKKEEKKRRVSYLTGLENKPQEVNSSYWTSEFWHGDQAKYIIDENAKRANLRERNLWESQYDQEHPSLVSDTDSRKIQRNLTSQQLLQYYGIDLSQLSANERKQISQNMTKNISLGKGLNGEQISDDQLKTLMNDQKWTREQALAHLYKEQYRYKKSDGTFDDRISYTGQLNEDILNLGIELQKLLSSDRKDEKGNIISGKITKESLDSKRDEYAKEFKDRMAKEKKEYTEEELQKYINQRIEDVARYIQINSDTGTFYTNTRGKELWDQYQQQQQDGYKILTNYGKNGVYIKPKEIEDMRSDMLHSRFLLDAMNNPNLDETEWLKEHKDDVTKEDAQTELAKSLRYRLSGHDMLAAFGYSLDQGNFALPGDPYGTQRKTLAERLLVSNLSNGRDINGETIKKDSEEWKDAIITAEERMMMELNKGQKIEESQREDLLRQVRQKIKDNQSYFNDTIIKIYHELKGIKLDIQKVAPVSEDLPNLATMAGQYMEENYQWADYKDELYTRFRGDLDTIDPNIKDPDKQMEYMLKKREDQMSKQRNAFLLFGNTMRNEKGEGYDVGRMNYYHDNMFSMNNRGDSNLGAGSADIASAVLDMTKDSEGKNGLDAVSMDWTLSNHSRSREVMRKYVKDRFFGMHDTPIDPKTGLQYGVRRLNPELTGEKEGLNIHREATSNILKLAKDEKSEPSTIIKLKSNLPKSVIERIEAILRELMKSGVIINDYITSDAIALGKAGWGAEAGANRVRQDIRNTSKT